VKLYVRFLTFFQNRKLWLFTFFELLSSRTLNLPAWQSLCTTDPLWSGTLHFILHTFLHPQMPIPLICSIEIISSISSLSLLSLYLELYSLHSTAYKSTDTHLTALCLGLPGWAGTRKVKPVWIVLKHEKTASGSGISWTNASLHFTPDRQTTLTSTPPLSFFTGQLRFLPTALKH